MESWVYASEGKAFMTSDETLACSNGFVHAKEVLNGWDLKSTFNYQNPILIRGPELIENKGISELGSWVSFKGTSGDKPMGVSVSSKVSDGRTAKTLFQKQDSGSKDSSSITDINGEDTSFIDLKLGRLADFKNVKDNRCPRDARSSFSVTSTVPAKKIRSACLNAQTPFCQVYGCNIDLSSSKDYHKRHKVCEIHSKTAKVIVNGIEQRFCQQCSRFHLLAEFDDGKRSCRKRLAGHNERRRKPQLDTHCRSGKLLQSCHGSGFLDTYMPVRTSFLCPEICPSGILHEVKYINGDWSQNTKAVDDEISSNWQPPMSAATGQFIPKAFLPSHNTENQFSSMYVVGNPSGDLSFEYRNQIQHGSAGSYLILNGGSYVQDFSGVTVACCASSLLSSQSQSASDYSSATSMAQSLVSQRGQAPYSVTQVSDMPLPVISHASTGMASNRFSSSGMNSPDDERMDLLVSSASNTVDFKIQTNVAYQGSQLVAKELLSPEHGSTVNLLQLSSLLQSAEERRLLQAEQECEIFSFTPIMEVE